MGIKDELAEELRAAMRARDRDRLDVIRQIETEVARARSEPGFSGEADDETYLAAVTSYVKRMEKALREYEDLGRGDSPQAAKLVFEVEYLRRWLPVALGEDETRALVGEAIAELGATDPKMAGRVVGHLMKSGREGLDGALVNRIVREELDAG